MLPAHQMGLMLTKTRRFHEALEILLHETFLYCPLLLFTVVSLAEGIGNLLLTPCFHQVPEEISSFWVARCGLLIW
jgi:hypothetical protein